MKKGYEGFGCVGMTREEIDAYVGKRAKIVRADGVTLVGRIDLDSLARFSIIGSRLRREIRYDQVVAIMPVTDSISDTD